MKQIFHHWMIDHERKQENTADAYAYSIDKISKYHSQMTGNLVDIYSMDNLEMILDIASDYKTTGRFAKYGYKGHGTIRNAIATYARFYNYMQKTSGGNPKNLVALSIRDLQKCTPMS